ncbi:MAG: NAD(P)-binding domain-containing protein [Thermoplasmata archaeon]
MDVGIIGAGYVGKAIGIYLKGKGHDVLFYDINPHVVDEIQTMGFFVSDNIKDVAKRRNIFLCVSTPTDKNGNQNLYNIISAITDLAINIKNTVGKHTLIIKSTIIPGTTEKVFLPIIYEHVNPENIGIIYSPEFLTEIDGTWTDNKNYKINPENEYRLIIGEGDNKQWGDILLKDIYLDINVPIIRTDYKTAEMIKYASNNALASRISYWNEMFLICHELGIDSNVVARASSLDPRIGIYGTVHGKGFGGKCLPKDLKAFVKFARKYHGVPLHSAVLKVNEYMKKKYGVRE